MRRQDPLSDLPRPLRLAAVRQAVLAPELERFLSRRNVDLLVTDQMEALQVRVRKGVEVLDQRAKKGVRVAGRRIASLGAAAIAGLTLAGLHVAAFLRGFFREGGLAAGILWMLATLAFLLAIASVIGLSRALSDKRELARLAGRYAGEVERARTPEELFTFAEKALREARAIGMVPVDD